MRGSDLLKTTPAGLYCPAGDFHVDPLRPVKRALITHGHSDHARAGHDSVLATRETLAIMAVRCGPDFAGATQTATYGERIGIDGLTVSFHPAGHVLGSAQICIEAKGLRIVISGDYKRARDPTCAPFELVPCDIFISEATFGLPVFRHPDAAHEIARLIDSCRLFPERAHLVGAYSLGKAQRIMALLREAGWTRPIYIHGTMEKLTRLYEREGLDLGEIVRVAGPERPKLGGEIIICPPSALQELWSRRFPEPVPAFASGWMRVRARARQGGVELPLVISDHADWDELCDTIVATGCSELWVTHGEEDALVHWATAQGLAARPLRLIGYGEEDVEACEPDNPDVAPTLV
ncbi:MAG: ligase-associated DNA damage response exonuclease [Methylobacteriaceae bacterium]|nr:ligase-associated DNA damage response exonuclease [Methylobacteriaceae bacterium]